MNPVGNLLRIATAITVVALMAQLVLSGLRLPGGVLGALVLSLLIAAMSAPFIQAWVVDPHAALVAGAGGARAGRAEFRALLDLVAEGVVIVDRDGRIRHVNRQAERLFGFERTELINQPVELLVPERFRNAHVRHRREYMADPDPVPLGIGRELVGRRRDGSEIPIELSLSPVGGEDDNRVVVLVTDISARKGLEEERELLARAVEQSAQAVVITDPGGRIRYVNPAMERLSGQPRETLAGLRPGELEGDARYASLFHEMRETLEQGRIWQSKVPAARADGAPRRREAAVGRLPDAGSRVGHDATEDEIDDAPTTEVSPHIGVDHGTHDERTV